MLFLLSLCPNAETTVSEHLKSVWAGLILADTLYCWSKSSLDLNCNTDVSIKIQVFVWGSVCQCGGTFACDCVGAECLCLSRDVFLWILLYMCVCVCAYEFHSLNYRCCQVWVRACEKHSKELNITVSNKWPLLVKTK